MTKLVGILHEFVRRAPGCRGHWRRTPKKGRLAVATLFAVDGHHLLYRAWFGFPTRILSRDKTRDLTGVFGFIALARKAHRLHAPDSEMLVVFDGENAAATRAGMDPAYKANRATADHTPIKSLAPLKQVLDVAGLRWVELDDHEGDDVIGTAIKQATAAGRDAICYSGDKDFYQLLDTARVKILTPGRTELAGRDIERRFGIKPEQWPDYRALIGDPADNIPGIRGVGPKTARDLLADGLKLEDLKGSPRLRNPRCASLSSAWDQLLTWRRIIEIDHQVPLPLDLTTNRATPTLPPAARLLEGANLW
ncbi:5'-3' exonuclease [Micromonospora sp. NPDC004704]